MQHFKRHPEPATPLTRRQMAKQQTRARLLDAARELIAERGYEAATVRDISAAAHLSTGAVFASFADKAALFREVILADYEHLYQQMAASSEQGGPAKAVLVRLLMLAYDSHLSRLRLVQAAQSFAWIHDVRTPQGEAKGARRVLDHLAAELQRGVDAGEFQPWLDVRLTSEMLWDSYISNYRRAIFDGWDREALRERLASQIDVLVCARHVAA